jgi:NADH-quinone oxidoreductase subunit J
MVGAAVFSGLMLGAALMAVRSRNLVHAALWVALAFLMSGGLMVALGAEFVGLVQVLVYVGAVAVLIAFVVLLTRPERVEVAGGLAGRGGWAGVAVAALVGLALLGVVGTSRVACEPSGEARRAAVAEIGHDMAGPRLLALQAVGVLLTAALVGAALIAVRDGENGGDGR